MLERLFLSILFLLGPSASALGGVLLIPNSGTGFDNVWAFDPQTGALLNNAFIPADGRMTQAINAVDSGRGTILVSDETSDAIFEYSYGGAYLRTVTDLGSSGLDAPFGMTVHNGDIFVASTASDNIRRFSYAGGDLGVFAADANALSPRDVVFRANDVLVSESAGDDIESFSSAGAYQGTFHASDGVTSIDFPQQMQELPNGNILVAGFSPPNGIYLFDPEGVLLDFFALNTSPRGVFPLGNGQILWAGGTRVGVLDPTTGISVDVVNVLNASFRFIEFSPAPEPAAGLTLVLAAMLALRRR